MAVTTGTRHNTFSRVSQADSQYKQTAVSAADDVRSRENKGCVWLTSELLWGVVEVSCIRLDYTAVIHQALGQKNKKRKLVHHRQHVIYLEHSEHSVLFAHLTSERVRVQYVVRGVLQQSKIES